MRFVGWAFQYKNIIGHIINYPIYYEIYNINYKNIENSSEINYAEENNIKYAEYPKNPTTYTYVDNIELNKLTHPYRRFKSWKEGDKYISEIVKGSTGNKTITAVWTKTIVFNINIPNDERTYKETYELNSTEKQSFGKDLINKSGQFGVWERKGYTLLGWSVDKDATKATYSPYSTVTNTWLNDDKVIKDNQNLYAVWKKN